MQSVTSAFQKRELVVTTDEQYPQHILIEFTQDKCDLLDKYKIGKEVKVSINIRGREWTNPQGETKYFNSIQGWRIEKRRRKQFADANSRTSTTIQRRRTRRFAILVKIVLNKKSNVVKKNYF